jgi:hypothetical protein
LGIGIDFLSFFLKVKNDAHDQNPRSYNVSIEEAFIKGVFKENVYHIPQ